MSRPITITDALRTLRPGAQWNLLDSTLYSTLEWLDTVQTKPTEQEVQDQITMLTLQQPYNECKEKLKSYWMSLTGRLNLMLQTLHYTHIYLTLQIL